MKRYTLLLGVLLCCIMLKAQSVSYTCRYWFDQNHEQAVTVPFSDSPWQAEIDVGLLSEGIHKFHLQIADTAMKWSSPQIYLFLKIADNLQEDLNCHYWFDQNHAQMQQLPLGNGLLLLNVSELEEGMHTVNVLLEGDALTTTTRYVFMKVLVDNPSAEYQYHCWFDNDINTMQTGWLGAGCFQLDTDGLTKGFHTVSVQLDDNGARSAPQLYMFYNQPLGGYGISRWEYWLNDDINNGIATNIVPSLDTLDIISLLPVETWPIRSTCFHFQPNGEEPYINAKNKVSFRFWDTEDYWIDQSTYYVDENISEPIVADTLERNTTVSIAAPRDNQIHWFKLEANRGDYLSFQSDKACTMQLFAPSGEEVYVASGPESIQEVGFNVWEDGVYYLAVHDVTGSGETVSVTYNWLNRYAIVAYDVHLVGNGGCSTITFQGNGFNSLLDAYLVNYQNDTIRQLDIGHESNTTTTISFNFYEVNLGTYDAVFEFFEETIRINGALEVQEPVDILLTTTVSYPSQFLINTPCTYTYTITNNGNMSAYAVPIYVYVSSQTKDGIAHLEIDGLDLPSVIDDIDLDSLSASDRIWLQEWADEIGEDHYFMKMRTINEETGDSIYVRTNFFFMTLAPFETKTIAIKVTANEPINVFVTVPNDVVQPLTFHQNRGFRDQYCCVHERASCLIQLVCGVVSLVSEVSNLAPGTPVWVISSMLDCICGIIEDIDQKLSDSYCQGDDAGFWSSVSKAFNSLKNMKSITKAVAHCVTSFLPSGSVRTVAKIADIIYNGTSTVQNCYNAFDKSPGCPPGPPKGGGAGPGNPFDPNDIHGYLSESGSHYMRQEIQNVQYEIEFENDTTLATAAAHTIIVRDTLDATKFDLNSLAARSVTIGDKRLDLNGEQTFARTLDLRPELYVIAQVNQDYDPTTGIIQWTIQSLDPMTMEPTDDPNQGVLPVNYYGNGVGFIDYSINLKQAFPDGTKIRNRAGIIFDQNDVIMTPIWTNIIDAVKPTSYIENVTFEADTLNFSFVSSDNRSGVWYHTLYYRNDSTEMEWKVKVPKIVENSYMLRFNEYQTTEYLVMAVDSAGNHEEKEMVVEYVYYYDGPEPMCQTNVLVQGWNWWSTYLDITLDDLKSALVATGNNAITIKSKNNGNTTYNGNIWRGQLNMLDVTQMYRISVGTDCEITLEGVSFNPAEHPVTIVPGVNWIGFPLCESMSLSNAFAEFTVSGDMVKSKNQGIATYNGTQWRGSLNTLVPGQGYIFKSTTTEDRIFTFPIGTK